MPRLEKKEEKEEIEEGEEDKKRNKSIAYWSYYCLVLVSLVLCRRLHSCFVYCFLFAFALCYPIYKIHSFIHAAPTAATATPEYS